MTEMAEYRTGGGNAMTPGMKRLRGRSDFQEMEDGTSVLSNFYSPPQQSFDSEEMRGSMQMILSENIGQFVVVEFLIGTENIFRKQGILFHVGRSYITLYDEAVNNFIVCDVFSIKFVYFYMPGDHPRVNYNILPGNNGETMNGRRTR